eukprot:5234388-Pleurochrysis_carterae.AAC.1
MHTGIAAEERKDRNVCREAGPEKQAGVGSKEHGRSSNAKEAKARQVEGRGRDMKRWAATK